MKEYKSEYLHNTMSATQLNEMSKKGWDLVSIIKPNHERWLYEHTFSRDIPKPDIREKIEEILSNNMDQELYDDGETSTIENTFDKNMAVIEICQFFKKIS